MHRIVEFSGKVGLCFGSLDFCFHPHIAVISHISDFVVFRLPMDLPSH